MDTNKSANERSKEWYEANREKAIEARKNYNNKNKERLSDYSKDWYEKNKLIQSEKKKEKYQENKKQIAEKTKKYRTDNPDKVKESHKKWRENNKDKTKEKLHNYRARKAGAFIETVKFSKVFESSKGICYICKCTVSTELLPNRILPKNYGVLDHVIPLNKGGLHCYENIKLACHECNSRKSDHIPEEGIQMSLFSPPGFVNLKPKETDEEKVLRKKAYMIEYRKNNSEKIKEQEKNKRISDRPEGYESRTKFKHLPIEERKKIYYERYHEKNKEEINERERKRKAAKKAEGVVPFKPSKEKSIEYSKNYLERNRDAVNARRRVNRAAKKEEIK